MVSKHSAANGTCGSSFTPSPLHSFSPSLPSPIHSFLPFLLFPFLLLLTACSNDASTTEELPAVVDNTDPGIAQLTDALRADPGNADLYAQRATMQYDKQNYDAAIADMVSALSIDSTNIGYHYNLADVYLDYYRSRLALRTLERAASLDPDNLETQLRLAETQLILKRYDGALKALNEVIRIDPRNPDAYLLPEPDLPGNWGYSSCDPIRQKKQRRSTRT